MAVAVLEVIPAVAALAEEDVGVRRVQDRLYVQILDTAVTAGACKLRTFQLYTLKATYYNQVLNITE